MKGKGIGLLVVVIATFFAICSSALAAPDVLWVKINGDAYESGDNVVVERGDELEFRIKMDATDNESDGINEGNNAGRCCWRIAGTLCAGKVQGSYAKKIKKCSLCNFYKLVESDVGNNFKP